MYNLLLVLGVCGRNVPGQSEGERSLSDDLQQPFWLFQRNSLKMFTALNVSIGMHDL